MEEQKNPLKVLITSDIRDHAHNWTLAGDVRLLGHLEQFSENICNKAQETQKRFTELIDNYEEVYTNICNVTNQLLAVQNCQFVENRVYDEETPTEEKTEAKVSLEAENEKLLLMQYKEAVEVGVKILDTHFQEVQLPPNSDSEEDEVSTGNSIIWKPKNPYACKKFPLLIGSNEWWADDKIGLGDYNENLETEKIISESESDVDLNQKLEEGLQSSFSSSSTENDEIIPTNQIFLDTSSEDLFVVKQNNKCQSDTSDFIIVGGNSIHEESESLENPSAVESKRTEKLLSADDNSLKVENVAKPQMINQKVSSAFTQELMSKLASVTNRSDAKAVEKAEENSPTNKMKEGNSPANKMKEDNSPAKKIKEYSSQTKKIKEDNSPAKTINEEKLFNGENLFDEDEDNDDLFSEKLNNASIGSNALFFDAENEDDENDRLFSASNNLLFEPEGQFDGSASREFHTQLNNETDLLKKDKVKRDEGSQKPKMKNLEKSLVSGLFDDLDDENALFDSKESGSIRNESSKAYDKMLSADLERENSEGIFNSINYDSVTRPSKKSFAEEKYTRNQHNTKEKDEEPIYERAAADVKQSQEEAQTSVFENYSGVSNKEHKISAISFPPEDDVDLFSSSFKEDFLCGEENKVDSSTKVCDGSGEVYDTLFVQKSKEQDSLSISSSRSSLFDDVGASKSRLASVFEKDKSSIMENDLNCTSDNSLLGERSLTEAEDKILFPSNRPFNSVAEKGKHFLFYDFDDSDDLFESTKEKKNNSEGKTLLQKTNKPEKNSLFDDVNDCEKQVGGFGTLGKAVGEEIGEVFKKSFLNDSTDDDLFNTPLIFSQERKTAFDSVDKKKVEITETERAAEIQCVNKTKLKETKNNDGQEPGKSGISLSNTELFAQESKSSEEGKAKSASSFNIKKDEPYSEAITKPKTVGKLNIPDNLKVKFESTVKHISPGGTKPNKEKIEDFVNNKGLEEPFEPPSNLLKCPSKDRIRIQARRRPQSRRARQEAIRNSDSNFGLDFKSENSPSEHPGTSSSSNACQIDPGPVNTKSAESFLSSPVHSNPLSPSTDEEDFFNIPELDTNYEKDDQSLFKNNLFYSSNNSKAEDNLLFDRAPVLSPHDTEKETESKDEDSLFTSSLMKSKVKRSNIFDDDGFGGDDGMDDESLFKTGDHYKGETQITFESRGKNCEDNNKSRTSIFDTDLEDEYDLFGNNSTSFNSKNAKEKVLTNDNKLQSKEKESPSFVDPLGLISNKDK